MAGKIFGFLGIFFIGAAILQQVQDERKGVAGDAAALGTVPFGIPAYAGMTVGAGQYRSKQTPKSCLSC